MPGGPCVNSFFISSHTQCHRNTIRDNIRQAHRDHHRLYAHRRDTLRHYKRKTPTHGRKLANYNPYAMKTYIHHTTEKHPGSPSNGECYRADNFRKLRTLRQGTKQSTKQSSPGIPANAYGRSPRTPIAIASIRVRRALPEVHSVVRVLRVLFRVLGVLSGFNKNSALVNVRTLTRVD